MRIFRRNHFLYYYIALVLHFRFSVTCFVICLVLTQAERAREGEREAWRGHGGREESHLISPGETVSTPSQPGIKHQRSNTKQYRTPKQIILNNLLIKSFFLCWPRGRLADLTDFSGRKSEVGVWCVVCGVWDCDIVTLWRRQWADLVIVGRHSQTNTLIERTGKLEMMIRK